MTADAAARAPSRDYRRPLLAPSQATSGRRSDGQSVAPAMAPLHTPRTEVTQLSPGGHRALGKAARRAAPRSSHAIWGPAHDRPDPTALLAEQDQTRVPQLAPATGLQSPQTWGRVTRSTRPSPIPRAPTPIRTSATTRCSPRPSHQAVSKLRRASDDPVTGHVAVLAKIRALRRSPLEFWLEPSKSAQAEEERLSRPSFRDVGRALTRTVTSATTSAGLYYATDTSGWRHRRLWPRGASCRRRGHRPNLPSRQSRHLRR